MKTRLLIIASIIAFFVSMVIVVGIVHEQNSNYSVSSVELEALADGEDLPIVKCRCPLFGSGAPLCLASNWGKICASGYNIHCENWDDNC